MNRLSPPIKIVSVLILLLFFIIIPSGELQGGGINTELSNKKNIISLNNIIVNKINKEIRVKVKLAINSGILEYFLVGDHGKTYESLFKISDNKPSDLNFALLLIGCKPLDHDVFINLLNEKDGLNKLRADHRGSMLEIEIFKGNRKVPWQQLVVDREGKNHNPVWVYTGGFFLQGNRYAGNLEMSYIGIWLDRSVVINQFSTHQNPYRGGFGFEMNQGLTVDEDYELLLRRCS